MATRRMPDDRVAAPTVALVHDWLTGMRGGERCLEVFCELFPSADLFTLLQVPGSVSPVIEQRRVVTSFLQQMPGPPAAIAISCPSSRRHTRARSRRPRPRALLQPRRGQERPRAPGRPAHLLLLHPHALRVGSLRRVLRRAGRPGHAPAHAAGGGGPPALGPRDRGGRAPLRGHLALRGGPDPAQLRPVGRRDLPAGGRGPLPHRGIAGRVLPRGLRPHPVQARGPGGGGGQPSRPPPRRGGDAGRKRRGFAPWPALPSSSTGGATTPRRRSSTRAAAP